MKRVSEISQTSPVMLHIQLQINTLYFNQIFKSNVGKDNTEYHCMQWSFQSSPEPICEMELAKFLVRHFLLFFLVFSFLTVFSSHRQHSWKIWLKMLRKICINRQNGIPLLVPASMINKKHYIICTPPTN